MFLWNRMKVAPLFVCLLLSAGIRAQTASESTDFTRFFTAEFLAGITAEANEGFPDRGLQKNVFVHFGTYTDAVPQEWAYRLNHPKVGMSLGVSEFGNYEALGLAITAMPIAEFSLFSSTKRRFSLLTGMGVSYFTEQFDPLSNPDNQAVTTDLTWAFRVFLKYRFLQSKRIDWHLGAGFFHHSNGHTRLPNQGFLPKSNMGNKSVNSLFHRLQEVGITISRHDLDTDLMCFHWRIIVKNQYILCLGNTVKC